MYLNKSIYNPALFLIVTAATLTLYYPVTTNECSNLIFVFKLGL